MEALLLDLEQRVCVLELDLILRGIDSELKRNDANSFPRAKQLALQIPPTRFSLALERLEQNRNSVHAWNKIASFLLATLQGAAASAQQLQLLHVDLANLAEGVIRRVRSTYNAEEAQFARKLLEVTLTQEANRFGLEFSIWLVELKSAPHTNLPLRVIGLDISFIYATRGEMQLDVVERLVRFALHCATAERANGEMHKGMEDAIRRLCEVSPVHAERIGILLVHCLHQCGKATVARAYKLAQRLRIAHRFPALVEEAWREEVGRMVALGPHKAFGWATLKPNRRELIIATLIQHNMHLTAHRLCWDEADLQRVEQKHGVRLDWNACAREYAERAETYLQLDFNQVSVYLIDSMPKLFGVQHLLLDGGGAGGILTLDVEWDPQHSRSAQQGMGAGAAVQLMQFARGSRHVFLLDISPTTSPLPSSNEFHAFMQRFIQAEGEIWGFGLEMDCKMLMQTFPQQVWPTLIKPRVRNIPVPNKNTGLKAVCEQVLGKALDKEQQMSAWSRRPLRPEQVHYAALDAHVLVLLHERLITANGGQVPHSLPPPPAAVAAAAAPEPNDVAWSDGGELRFFCDEMLARTAKLLRTANVDCVYESSTDAQLKRRDVITRRVERALQEGRIFLTADRKLDRCGKHVYCVQAWKDEERFEEICHKFAIKLDPGSILLRCTLCNGPGFSLVTRDEARAINPVVMTDLVYRDERITEFYACAQCHSVVWQGPKYAQVQARMSGLMNKLTNKQE